MRARTGCQACRERHIKCVREDASNRCQKCTENDRACFQTSRHRFRPVTSVNLKSADDRTIKQNLVYDASQRWVDIPSQVEFVDSAREGMTFETRTAEEREETRSEPSTSAHHDVFEGIDTPQLNQIDTEHLIRLSTAQDVLLPIQDDAATQSQALTSSALHIVSILNQTTPSHASKRSRSDPFDSPTLFHPTTSPNLSVTPSWPITSQHEANLFHYYIKHCAPWIDATDQLRHFGTEVPRRVPYYPIIANGIFALASRQMAMTKNEEDTESMRYTDKCLEILIKGMDDPYAHWDENLLAGVVILRLHEELSHDDDLRCHLFGTRKILDSISAFAADGGLREAASWVSLRQHIYVSLTEQQPLDINLQNFRHSAAFHDASTRNEDWANRIVFLFGTILDYAFAPATTPAPNRWHELRAEVQNWFDSKPWDFAPLWADMNPEAKIVVSTPASVPGAATTPADPPPYYLRQTASISGSSYPLKPWPELLMAHRAQVTGLQYYHLARVVLAVYDPELIRLGFGTLRARKQSERIVLDGMRNIVGLAASNEDVTNAIFEASHILKTCGGYLKEEAEQNAAVAFLERAQQRMGWTTGKTIAELRQQWAGQ